VLNIQHFICVQFNGCSFVRLQPGVIGGEKSNMGAIGESSALHAQECNNTE